jgi:diguanylate cyclase
VAETADWKQKYRDSLLEMEAEEKRWRQVEQVLRRLIGRLCAAGMGVNPQLDDELSQLAAANRRNADAEELARLSDTLTTTVMTVDAAAPIHASLRGETDRAVRTAVATLIKRMFADDDAASKSLLTRLAAAHGDDALAAVIAQAADLVVERGASLAKERQQSAAVLAEVMRRLDEMTRFLTSEQDAGRGRFEDTHSHNEAVITQVRELTIEVNAATELGALQSLVSASLVHVAERVYAFRAREEGRLLEYNGRTEQMCARIADLEREARELQSQLTKESTASRVDALTGVTNRKGFEERFAAEVAAVRPDSPTALLLWDIDRFKEINDNFGHRAGDRVLQRVAESLNASIGPQDLLARIGGEEFVMLLQGRTLGDATHVAERIRAGIEAINFHFRGSPVRVTISCGFTQLHLNDATDAAFNRADAALYRAKNGGRNMCIAA